MFIRNSSSIPSNSVLWVDENEKKHLESLGFCVLSYKDQKYAFTKTNDILNILDSMRIWP